jgi:TnpA family transposase
LGIQSGVPINATIIGTHEHESHYVYDLLHNNTTDIKPERHSTDTHGTNQVNFWLLRVFGYQFAPRYRDLHKKIDGLVGFKHPKHYADYLIKPGRKAYDDLICKEWPNVQRIIASIAQKDVTQANMVRMLSSYGRQNQTKKALWELDNLCRTLYILTFIDDLGLRQSVQKALNRGEAYHRFPRHRLRQRGKVSRPDRGRAAHLERVLALDRQRRHLLQHFAAIARLRAKARRRRPRGSRHRQRRLPKCLATHSSHRRLRL